MKLHHLLLAGIAGLVLAGCILGLIFFLVMQPAGTVIGLFFGATVATLDNWRI